MVTFFDCPECGAEKKVVPGIVYHAFGQTPPDCTVQGVCIACKKEVFIEKRLLNLPVELRPTQVIESSEDLVS